MGSPNLRKLNILEQMRLKLQLVDGQVKKSKVQSIMKHETLKNKVKIMKHYLATL